VTAGPYTLVDGATDSLSADRWRDLDGRQGQASPPDGMQFTGRLGTVTACSDRLNQQPA
jgi:hypothetical protein